jgi:DNA-binding NarL/FixJ family response regulator
MAGIDLSREILEIHPDIPIILCSRIRDSETKKQVKSLGIRAYCIKPLTRRDLSGVIRDTLDGDAI